MTLKKEVFCVKPDLRLWVEYIEANLIYALGGGNYARLKIVNVFDYYRQFGIMECRYR